LATNERVRERVGSVQALSTVSEELARRFLAIYRDAFAPLDELAPARQSLTDEEFLDEMADTSVVKFLASDRGGVPCALAFMATDLSVVPWISLPYFQARFPEHYARGAIYYFGALLVRPELQGGAWARLLLEELVRRVASDHAVAAFDCCEHNASVTRLPELIARVGHRLSVLDAVELDPQRYFAYQFAGLR
jgi:GNAT superfamily N-acetyltransferase